MVLEAPCFAVGERGIALDRKALAEELARLKDEGSAKAAAIRRKANAPNLKVGSTKQLQEWFNANGAPTTSTDRENLEKIVRLRGPEAARARDVAALVLDWRSHTKLAQFLSAVPGANAQFALRPAGTVSWRFSCQKPPVGRGLNIQTIPKSLRRVFVPRPGFLMGQADQRTAESMVVAHVSGDQAYIDAHNTSDVHCAVARHIWGDIDETEIRRPKFLREWSRRDLAKRITHATNYGASEYSHARTLHIPVAEAKRILEALASAFPNVAVWRERIRTELERFGTVTYPFGFTLRVSGNRFDNDTVRSAVASIPQAIVAWTNHLVFTRLWLELDGPEFHVLAHGHDAVLFEYRPGFDLARLEPLMQVHWPFMPPIPFDIKTGSNWKECS